MDNKSKLLKKNCIIFWILDILPLKLRAWYKIHDSAKTVNIKIFYFFWMLVVRSPAFFLDKRKTVYNRKPKAMLLHPLFIFHWIKSLMSCFDVIEMISFIPVQETWEPNTEHPQVLTPNSHWIPWRKRANISVNMLLMFRASLNLSLDLHGQRKRLYSQKYEKKHTKKNKKKQIRICVQIMI